MVLGKLEKVPLRKAWNHEAIDFTKWLAQEENLAVLSDEIGIDITLTQTEASVGKFNVDILAEEENTGRKIVIENQLEPTNHDHLGKLVTYASGYDAEIIIWIVENVRDEHKKALDWLNEHTDEDINFFLIKMELWQIADSPFAPKFQVVSQPNDWAKTIKKSASSSTLTDTKVLQLEFWNKFKEYALSKGTKLKLRKTSPQHWYDISLGISDAHIALTVIPRERTIRCEVWISDSKELFYQFRKNKEQIEAGLGEQLNWMELPDKKASRVVISREADIYESDEWGEYFEWLLGQAEKFYKVFPKYSK
ncbi:DUF4268 domain-containing protein [Candidatus Microgenomates bacterium]|nr:DUF4268 domain-containing protein [Candidatus Microgenomates bacterium]